MIALFKTGSNIHISNTSRFSRKLMFKCVWNTWE